MRDKPFGLLPAAFIELLRAYPWILVARMDSVLPGDLMKTFACKFPQGMCIEHMGRNASDPTRNVRSILSNN